MFSRCHCHCHVFEHFLFLLQNRVNCHCRFCGLGCCRGLSCGLGHCGGCPCRLVCCRGRPCGLSRCRGCPCDLGSAVAASVSLAVAVAAPVDSFAVALAAAVAASGNSQHTCGEDAWGSDKLGTGQNGGWGAAVHFFVWKKAKNAVLPLATLRHRDCHTGSGWTADVPRLARCTQRMPTQVPHALDRQKRTSGMCLTSGNKKSMLVLAFGLEFPCRTCAGTGMATERPEF